MPLFIITHWKLILQGAILATVIGVLGYFVWNYNSMQDEIVAQADEIVQLNNSVKMLEDQKAQFGRILDAEKARTKELDDERARNTELLRAMTDQVIAAKKDYVKNFVDPKDKNPPKSVGEMANVSEEKRASVEKTLNVLHFKNLDCLEKASAGLLCS